MKLSSLSDTVSVILSFLLWGKGHFYVWTIINRTCNSKATKFCGIFLYGWSVMLHNMAWPLLSQCKWVSLLAIGKKKSVEMIVVQRWWDWLNSIKAISCITLYVSSRMIAVATEKGKGDEVMGKGSVSLPKGSLLEPCCLYVWITLVGHVDDDWWTWLWHVLCTRQAYC